MINTEMLDELTRKLASALPQNVSVFQQDIEKNLRAGLEGLFQKLDLVTREEYEVQVALLARSRERLALLEKQIEALETSRGLAQPQSGKD
ncbi:MAG: accessory factor UbiK family protein [Pseudomonadota bacterium]